MSRPRNSPVSTHSGRTRNPGIPVRPIVADPQPTAARPQSARTAFFGPGLVSAASNNDPTTVATLAVAGATTGYGLCWLIVLLVPALALVQSLAADIGATCGTSLQGAIRRHYGRSWATATLCGVAIVNVITLAADIRAGSQSLSLLTHLPAAAFVVPFAAGAAWLLLFHSYRRIERYLSLLPVAFVAYAASAVLAHCDLGALLRGTFVPHLSGASLAVVVAILGTTLTSYVYMWESIEVAEGRSSGIGRRAFERDAVRGMLAVGAVFAFILVANAATLGKHHVAIQDAADAAAALAPLAGPWAGTLFALGLFASALLAVPVLAGTTAYVSAHTFGWSGSLDSAVSKSKRFYAVIVLSLALAACGAFVPVALIPLLYGASIAGGLATPLTLFFLVRIAADGKVMGEARVGRTAAAAAWAVTAAVTLAGLALIVPHVFH